MMRTHLYRLVVCMLLAISTCFSFAVCDVGIEYAASLVKKAEGYEPRRYRCPAGILTIGYGHTAASPCSNFRQLPDVITADEAEKLLRCDLQAAQKAVRKLVHVRLSAAQEAALIDFVVNFGETRLATSTLLTELNKGNYDSFDKELPKWIWYRDPTTGEMRQAGGLISRRKRALDLVREENK